jgi:hypothetical protein
MAVDGTDVTVESYLGYLLMQLTHAFWLFLDLVPDALLPPCDLLPL